ncbi:unnamed protein product, partial [Ectocarpus sp. 13 AM-2016]
PAHTTQPFLLPSDPYSKCVSRSQHAAPRAVVIQPKPRNPHAWLGRCTKFRRLLVASPHAWLLLPTATNTMLIWPWRTSKSFCSSHKRKNVGRIILAFALRALRTSSCWP